MINFTLFIAALCKACSDAVMSNNDFAKYGFWFSWKAADQNKYVLTEWLNKFLPLWLSKFLAQDILIIFCDFWHLCQALLAFSFILAASFYGLGITAHAIIVAFIVWVIWSTVFNILYWVVR